MKGLSLFSGIGGIDIAAHWAGIETVAFCEREPFPQKVLQKNFPGIPIYDDVCTLTKERLEQDGIGTIDIIHGGYPCQPFSQIGKRKGETDERYLWGEFFRLVKELRPRWIVGENVAGHISMGLDTVFSDLESEGYKTRAFVLPALSVGAPHERQRVFVVGNSCSKSEPQTNQTISTVRSKRNTRDDITRLTRRNLSPSYWQVHQPPILGVDDGIPNRLDRSIALGNAVVPQQIYPILAAIKAIDAQGGETM